MSTRTPRSAAFKKKVALEAIKEDQLLSQIAVKYGVHPIQVGKWKKELLDGAEMLFANKRSKDSFEAEREALERKIGQLTIENDYLKKKLGC